MCSMSLRAVCVKVENPILPLRSSFSFNLLPVYERRLSSILGARENPKINSSSYFNFFLLFCRDYFFLHFVSRNSNLPPLPLQKKATWFSKSISWQDAIFFSSLIQIEKLFGSSIIAFGNAWRGEKLKPLIKSTLSDFYPHVHPSLQSGIKSVLFLRSIFNSGLKMEKLAVFSPPFSTHG